MDLGIHGFRNLNIGNLRNLVFNLYCSDYPASSVEGARRKEINEN